MTAKSVFFFLAIIMAIIIGNSTIAAGAEKYPLKPIEVVCPYLPGSSMDIMSRFLADMGPKYLGQPMAVVNKPGAGGSLAAAYIITSKPDGYKIVTLTNVFFATTIRTQKVPFDQFDLLPVANFMEYKLVLVVKGDAPWKNLNALLDYGRKNPGKLRWAHSGRGITLHLNGLSVFRKARVETIDIPYKGNPESLVALLGGHVDAACVAYGAAKEQIAAGKVRPLVLFSDRRYSDPADVPCVVELGFPEAAKLPTLVGFYIHKDTPEEIRKMLTGAFKKMYDSPEFKKGIENLGEEPRFGDPEYVLETIREGEKVGIPIIKELGLYVGK
jgi:tripartite-type tricarboxylate transporter receptor subunit TctC